MVAKPKNDIAMTSTERSRIYRQRKNQQGNKEINIILPEDALKKIDELVEFFELSSRAILMKELLKKPLIDAIEAMHIFQEKKFKQFGSGALNNDAEDILRATKNALWASIVNGVSDEMENRLRESQSKIDAQEQVSNR